jgi:hypothetical protein
MADQVRVDQPIDWSNPNDPKTKEALKDLFHALVEEGLIQAETHEILKRLYLTEKRDDLQRTEEIASRADQEIKKFWETLRPDASLAMKNKDKEALSQCLNVVTAKITDLKTENSALSVTISQHQQNISKVTDAWTARHSDFSAEIVTKLAGKLTDHKGIAVTAARLTDVMKKAAPAAIDKFLGQKDMHAKVEALLSDLGPIDRTQLLQQMARGQAHLTQLRICAELYKENGEMPTGPKLLEAVKNLKELGALMAEMMQRGGSLEDAADMMSIHGGYKEIFAAQKKMEENQKKIAVLEGAKANLENSLNQLNIPAPPAPPPPPPPPPASMRHK